MSLLATVSPIVVEFVSNGTSNSNFTYVITDDQNNILGIPPGNSQDFEGAGPGVCRVWGLSYTGTITAAAGDNAATTDLTDGCFDLSDNYIEVIRMDPAPDPIVGTGGIKVALSPNPTPNVVFISMEMEELPVENATTVSVYHISGQLIHAEQFSAIEGQNTYEMDLGHLEEGFYKMTVSEWTGFYASQFCETVNFWMKRVVIFSKMTTLYFYLNAVRAQSPDSVCFINKGQRHIAASVKYIEGCNNLHCAAVFKKPYIS